MKDISKTAAIAALAVIALSYGAVFGNVYFTNEFIPWHDYCASFVSGHIVTNYLLNGSFPLWSPEQNCGSPVWPDTEVFPGYDPVSQAVNFAFALGGRVNTVHVHIVTVFIWHVMFAGGAYLLFRKTGLGRLSSSFGFAVLLFSSLTVLNLRQTDDYVTVYRYVPLLFYFALRFLGKGTLSNSLLLGLAAGLSVTGYQTPNIALLVLFALIAAIPLYKNIDKKTLAGLVPAAVVAVFVSMPFLVAASFWITNVASAREFFQLGYRGGLGDIVGPLSKHYPDETIISIGLIPFAFAFLRLAAVVREQFGEAKTAYWPGLYMLVWGLLIWIMYIGFPENFSGVDKPFLYIRSFNNMLPYVMLVLVYFSCQFVDGLHLREGGGRFPRPIMIFILLAVVITVFTELSRPSILSITLNRYALETPPNGLILIEHFLSHLSSAHMAVSFAIAAALFAVFLAASKGRRNIAVACIIALTAFELSLLNQMLIERHSGYAQPAGNLQGMPYPKLDAPMPSAPPESRPRIPDLDNRTFWFKQGNTVYHAYSSMAPISYTWFRTKAFDEFAKTIVEERFDFLTGVTRPIIYTAHKAVAVDRGRILEALNTLPLERLEDSIVVEREGFSGPPELPAGEGGGYEVSDFGPNRLKTRVSLKSPAYLVYLDSHADGWTARIDGEKTPIIRANYLFKSVLVPAGEHEVEFRYRPYPYIVASFFRVVGIAGPIGFLLWGLIAGLRRRMAA